MQVHGRGLVDFNSVVAKLERTNQVLSHGWDMERLMKEHGIASEDRRVDNLFSCALNQLGDMWSQVVSFQRLVSCSAIEGLLPFDDAAVGSAVQN